jgi:hypothetical protein
VVAFLLIWLLGGRERQKGGARAQAEVYATRDEAMYGHAA